MQIQRPIRAAFLLFAALLTSVVFLRNQPEEQSPAAAPRLGIGYYVKQARLTGTGPDGRILYRVTTSAAEQNVADGTISMDGVEVDYEPAAEVPWKLRANRGQIPPDRNIIELSGDVVVTAQAAAPVNVSPAPLTIRTDYLELDPDAYIAMTDRGVAVERSRDTLRARGMRVYLKQDRLQLNAEVRGRFLP